MKHLGVWSFPVPYYLIHLRPKYSAQHPSVKHTKSPKVLIYRAL